MFGSSYQVHLCGSSEVGSAGGYTDLDEYILSLVTLGRMLITSHPDFAVHSAPHIDFIKGNAMEVYLCSSVHMQRICPALGQWPRAYAAANTW
jgi:hypothetical protein